MPLVNPVFGSSFGPITQMAAMAANFPNFLLCRASTMSGTFWQSVRGVANSLPSIGGRLILEPGVSDGLFSGKLTDAFAFISKAASGY